MNLIQAVGDEFDTAIQARGQAYFDEGRVTLGAIEEPFVSASVRGSQLYSVELEKDGGTLVIDCDCPYFEGNDQCKHVWATLLAVDQAGYLQPTARQRSMEVRSVEVWYADDDDQEFSFDDDDHPTASGPAIKIKSRTLEQGWRKMGIHGKVATPAPPTWHQIFARLQNHAQPAAGADWAADRELIYCLDKDDSLVNDDLRIQVMFRQARKLGGWTLLKPLRLAAGAIASLPLTEDRQILSLLRGADIPNGGHFDSDWSYIIPAPMMELVIPLLCATGRCGFNDPEDSSAVIPCNLDSGAPWRFKLEVTRDAEASVYRMAGRLERAGEIRALFEPNLLLQSGWVFWKNSVARLEHANAFDWICQLRKFGPISIPEKEIADLPALLANLRYMPPIELPEEIRYEEVGAAPHFCVSIRTPGYRTYPADVLHAKLGFEYNGFETAPDIAASAICNKESRQMIRRDLAAEQGAVQLLDSLMKRLENGPRNTWTWVLRPSELSGIVSALMLKSWTVEAEGRSFRKPGSFSMDVSSGIDWFELSAKVDFEGVTVDLPALLKAIKNKQQFVTLGDGTVGVLPEDWLRQYGLFAKLGEVDGEVIRFKRHQAGLLDALLQARPDVKCDETFARVRAELQSFDSIAPVAPPSGFTGVLRDYQADGLAWLHFLRRFGFGGCLADDMGLGKTIQVLAMLEGRRAEGAGPTLVVVPRSLVFNWMQEAARFAPALRILDHTHPERERESPVFGDADIVLVTYGIMCRDISRLVETNFDYVVLDEAQAIKNDKALVAKAARLLRSRHRLAMSGTPVQNHLGELWSLFEFLNPGILGAASVFNATGGLGRDPAPETRELLARALRPFILRRTKGQVARELPERTEDTLYCELEGKQRKLYNELRDHYKAALLSKVARNGMAKSKILIIEALLRLRQAACHPGLIDPKRLGEPCAKLEVLMAQLIEVMDEGHKVLVFSQFTSFLDILRKQLKAQDIRYEYLDGKTRDRQAPVERFQNDADSKLFLISLKAGGLGLNLTAAEYVFLLDPWWNPAIEAQAIDRAHRLGQVSKVFAYRLIARDTVEEKVLELQKSKKALADSIINADNSLIRGLTREDLQLLLA